MSLETIRIRVDEGKEDLVGRIIRNLSMVKEAHTSGPGEVMVDIHQTSPDSGILARAVFRNISHVKKCLS